MCIGGAEYLYDDQGVEIGFVVWGLFSESPLQVLYSQIPGNSWNPQRLEKLRQNVQDRIDYRIPINSLPADDPFRLADPATAHIFWDGNDLVQRNAVLEELTYTDNPPHVGWVLSRTH